ncbi:MAG: DUF3450 family protein [Planctomycetota bacterium]
MTIQRFIEPRRLLGVAVVAAAGLLLAAALPQDDLDDGGIGASRAALERKFQAEQLISKERREWRTGKQLLNERIGIVRAEITSLREAIREAEENLAAADDERDRLLAEKERLATAAAGLAQTVGAIEERTKGLLARLPDPIRQRVLPLSQSIPEDPAATEQGLGSRFRNVIGVLNEVNKFQRDVLVQSELRELPDGRSVEVTTMYLGVGQAYYVSETAGVAGVGTAGAEGWVWTAKNDALDAIAAAVAVYENTQEARFVGLPMELR